MMKEMDYSSNILIVTIDPDISNVLGILLNNLNYKIELTNSGTEAFKELSQNKFDLMLLDMILPDMNVLQVLNYVKKISPDTLVIVMTGEALYDRNADCLKSGAYDCLKKPFGKEEIIKRIENALDQRRLEKEIEITNELIRAADRRNEYLIQSSDDIIYTLDYEGKFTSVNDSLTQKIGCDNNFLFRKHFTTIIHPEDVDKAMYIFNERRTAARYTEAAKIRLLRSVPTGAKKRINNYITVEVKAKGIYDRHIEQKDKLFLGTYGIARDISDFIKNEEVLRLQKTYFKELFNKSTEAIVIIDNDAKIISANKSFEKLFKYNHTELKDNYIHDLILPMNISPEDEIPTDLVFTEKESVRKCKDGTAINVMINGYPIEYNNKIIGAFRVYTGMADAKRNEERLYDHLAKIRQSIGSIAHAMVSTVEVRDPYTVGHQQRVSNLARAIACELGLARDEIDAIRLAGTLHDLGKVNIPAEILSKPGHLSNIELDLVKMHPTIAYEILRKIEFPWSIAEIVYQHHERLDGSGYPRGLKGKNILLPGRILSVADVVESIASHRPYRPALGIHKALEEISSKKNIHYDPDVVDACVRLFNEKNFSLERNLPEEIDYSYYQMPVAALSN